MLCFCRKEAEVVRNYDLSRMKAQQAAHCKLLVLQPRQEKEEVLLSPLLQVHEVTEQRDWEEEWREAGGRRWTCTGEVSR